jgi:hypothetical protein
MSTHRDPHSVNAPADGAAQHEPRVPGGLPDERVKYDHPGKPFRTPNKNATHPAPDRAADGEPVRKDLS